MLKTRQNFCDLINQNKFKIGAEIGVRYGWFSKYLLDNSNLEKLYSIDCWENNAENYEPQLTFQHTKDLLKPYVDNRRCDIVKGYSLNIAQGFCDSGWKLDFVYIDALHDYESVLQDIQAWYHQINSGGVIAGHDYNMNAWPGVYKAVNEFAESERLTLHLTGIGDTYGEGDGNQPSWWFQC